MGDQKCQRGGTEREIDQVAGEPVGRLLNRRARFFRAFHFLDDSSERGIAAKPLDANFQGAGLIDRSRVDASAGKLFDRDRLPGDGRLVDEGVAAYDGAIHGNMPAGTHQDYIARRGRLRLRHPANRNLGAPLLRAAVNRADGGSRAARVPR